MQERREQPSGGEPPAGGSVPSSADNLARFAERDAARNRARLERELAKAEHPWWDLIILGGIIRVSRWSLSRLGVIGQPRA